MQVNWFFATTPAPRIVRTRRASKRAGSIPWKAWWDRAGDRLVAWGEQAQHHRLGSWMRRP